MANGLPGVGGQAAPIHVEGARDQGTDFVKNLMRLENHVRLMVSLKKKRNAINKNVHVYGLNGIIGAHVMKSVV